MSRDIEKYAADYLADDFEKIMSQYRKELIISRLYKYHAKRILDIGPAYNFCFRDYREYEKYVIVEPSLLMCQNIEPAKNVEIINNKIENVVLQLKKMNFDFVIASGLLHEVEDEIVFLDAIKEICCSETIVHISVPNSNSFHLRFAREAGMIPRLGELTDYSRKMQRCRTYQRKSFNAALTGRGFSIVEEGSFFLKFFNQSKMQQCVESNILDDALLAALAQMGEWIPDAAAEIWTDVQFEGRDDA